MPQQSSGACRKLARPGRTGVPAARRGFDGSSSAACPQTLPSLRSCGLCYFFPAGGGRGPRRARAPAGAGKCLHLSAALSGWRGQGAPRAGLSPGHLCAGGRAGTASAAAPGRAGSSHPPGDRGHYANLRWMQVLIMSWLLGHRCGCSCREKGLHRWHVLCAWPRCPQLALSPRRAPRCAVPASPALPGPREVTSRGSRRQERCGRCRAARLRGPAHQRVSAQIMC